VKGGDEGEEGDRDEQAEMGARVVWAVDDDTEKEEDNAERGHSDFDHSFLSPPPAAAAVADAPALGLGGSVDSPAPPVLGVQHGGCFTVTLGNRSTQARYFLQTTAQVQELLTKLASVSATVGTVSSSSPQGAEVGAKEAAEARLPNAMERAQLLLIQERLAKCLTPAFCLE
jgi:hypothetical protein